MAGYKRMLVTENNSDQLSNFEALIKYYEDGGKIPEGKEEVWAFNTPNGWAYKHRWYDVSSFCLCHY